MSEQTEPSAAAPSDPQVLRAETAFVVYMDQEGHWIATTEAFTMKLELTRGANQHDFLHAAMDITSDVTAWKSGMQMMAQMASQAQVMAQAKQNQDILAATGMGGGLDLSKLRQG